MFLTSSYPAHSLALTQSVFPVQGLPTELLCRVLLAARDVQAVEEVADIYCFETTPPVPLVVSSVCQQWRRIALDEPRLWCYLRVSTWKRNYATGRSYQLLNCFATRAKSVAMDLCIIVPENTTSYHVKACGTNAVELLHSIGANIRIRSLTLVIPDTVLSLFDQSTSTTSIFSHATLRELDLRIFWAYVPGDRYDDPDSLPALSEAQNVESIELRSRVHLPLLFGSATRGRPPVAPRWYALRRFVMEIIDGAREVDALYDALANSPLLEELTVTSEVRRRLYISDADFILKSRRCTFPRLRMLVMQCPTSGYRMERFMGSLVAPELRSLTLCFPHINYCALVEFLERSGFPCIEHLGLAIPRFGTPGAVDDLVASLKRLPTLLSVFLSNLPLNDAFAAAFRDNVDAFLPRLQHFKSIATNIGLDPGDVADMLQVRRQHSAAGTGPAFIAELHFATGPDVPESDAAWWRLDEMKMEGWLKLCAAPLDLQLDDWDILWARCEEEDAYNYY